LTCSIAQWLEEYDVKTHKNMRYTQRCTH